MLIAAGVTPETVLAWGVEPETVLFAGQPVWPTSSDWDWEEQFDDVDLPAGWSILFGEHNPPGIHMGYLQGPTIMDADFEIGYDLGDGEIGLISAAEIGQNNQIAASDPTLTGALRLNVMGSLLTTANGVFQGGEIILRHLDGMFSIWHQGEMARTASNVPLELPSPAGMGPGITRIIAGVFDSQSRITAVRYRAL